MTKFTSFTEADFIKKLHTHAKDRVGEGVASYGKFCSKSFNVICLSICSASKILVSSYNKHVQDIVFALDETFQQSMKQSNIVIDKGARKHMLRVIFSYISSAG